MNNIFPALRDHRQGRLYTEHTSDSQTSSPIPFEDLPAWEVHAKGLVVFRRRNTAGYDLNPDRLIKYAK